MANLSFLAQWRMVGESVRGYSHIRKESPNQDSITWSHRDKIGGNINFRENVYIMAVSDGHGSAKSFRSDVGSQIAVRAAKERISVFLDGQNDSTADQIEQIAYKELVPAILSHWRNAVKSHLDNTPVSDDERQKLVRQDNFSDEKLDLLISSSPTVIYGATLLSVAITDKFILYLRIGDGDILTVGSDGTSALAIEKDADLLGVETTSLCEKDADTKFRIKVIQRSTSDPAMVLLSTDGYSNSFASNDDFLAIGKDYLQMVRSYGGEFVAQQLPQFLTETSKKGSGDDITLGIIKRPEFFDADVQKDLIKFLNELMQNTNEHSETVASLSEKVSIIDSLKEAVNTQQTTAERAEENMKEFVKSLAQLQQKQDTFDNEFSEQKGTIVSVQQSQDTMTNELSTLSSRVGKMGNTQDKQLEDISTLSQKQDQHFAMIAELKTRVKSLGDRLESQQDMVIGFTAKLNDLEKAYKTRRTYGFVLLGSEIIIIILVILHLLRVL